MKHLKSFESTIEDEYVPKIGDTVICIRKDLIETDNTPVPIYGNPYIITDISQNTYLNIIDPTTQKQLGAWNKVVFMPDYKWNSIKFNI